ncbi:hypothetical protein ACLMJK_005080 [Lecanora helva]
MAPRLIRRRPLAERIKAYLNPLDLLLWLSEQVDSGDWDQWQKDWATPFGVLLNTIFLIARANSGYSTRGGVDDVFGDDVAYTGWMAWFAAFIVHFLSLFSFVNAVYTFYRKRHYRLFESSIDTVPSTPSAHRVRVDSSPVSSSPLRFLSTVLAGETPESRSHPDATRDVWEIAVWDPAPIALQMFCLFSPGHVLVYWLCLPTTLSDTRPSTTIFTTIILAALLSTQLLLLQTSFSQQSKDAAVIHKEVMNEYDIKYVHPRTQPLMRDVGTQFSDSGASTYGLPRYEDANNTVDVYTPTFILKKAFETRPNPNYVKHVNPESTTSRPTPSRGPSTEMGPPFQTPAHLRDASSPVRPQTAIRQPQFRATGAGGGGNLGVYTHANSPLRKSASTHFAGPQGMRERSVSPQKREGSPLKRSSLAPLPNGQRWDALPTLSTRRGELDRAPTRPLSQAYPDGADRICTLQPTIQRQLTAGAVLGTDPNS